MTDPTPHHLEPADPEKRKILNLYAAFGVSLLISVIPSAVVGLVAMLFILAVLIGAYIVRKGAEETSLLHNHTTYIIRTIWIGTGLSVVTLSIASAYMLPQIDYAPFAPCANDLAAQGLEFAETATFAEVYAFTEPCLQAFVGGNFNIMLLAAIIAGAPILIYFAYRYIKGLTRAIKGYRLAHPKAYF